jgi:hypothetical protein
LSTALDADQRASLLHFCIIDDCKNIYRTGQVLHLGINGELHAKAEPRNTNKRKGIHTIDLLVLTSLIQLRLLPKCFFSITNQAI